MQLLPMAVERGQTSARTRVAAMIATGVDGVMIDVGALEALGERPPVPVMCSTRQRGPPASYALNFDLESGAEALATHLLELGHRRIGFVQADRPTPTLTLRHRVFARRVHAVGGAALDTPSEITIEAAPRRRRASRQPLRGGPGSRRPAPGGRPGRNRRLLVLLPDRRLCLLGAMRSPARPVSGRYVLCIWIRRPGSVNDGGTHGAAAL